MKPLEFFLVGFLLFFITNLMGQNIYVYAEQELNFGAFYLSNNSSGEITIRNTGERASSGNVKLLNSTQHPAVFKITTDSQVPIKVEVEVFVQKMLNSKGNEMQITLLNYEPSVYILQTGFPVQVIVGGKLNISSKDATATGYYSGSISLRVNTFNE